MLQAEAALERLVVDLLHTRLQRDTPQVLAVPEGALPHARYGGGDHNLRQPLAILECPVADFRHALRNLHASARAFVLYQTPVFDDKAIVICHVASPQIDWTYRAFHAAASPAVTVPSAE